MAEIRYKSLYILTNPFYCKVLLLCVREY